MEHFKEKGFPDLFEFLEVRKKIRTRLDRGPEIAPPSFVFDRK